MSTELRGAGLGCYLCTVDLEGPGDAMDVVASEVAPTGDVDDGEKGRGQWPGGCRCTHTLHNKAWGSRGPSCAAGYVLRWIIMMWKEDQVLLNSTTRLTKGWSYGQFKACRASGLDHETGVAPIYWPLGRVGECGQLPADRATPVLNRNDTRERKKDRETGTSTISHPSPSPQRKATARNGCSHLGRQLQTPCPHRLLDGPTSPQTLPIPR